MARITTIAHYIPELFESNFEKQQKFEVNDNFIVEKLGIHQVARKSDDEDTSDMCVNAYNALPDNERSENVDCLLVCTQNPDGGGVPHTSAIVHGKLGLSENCACFDVALGCSGYVYSLSILESFMKTNGFKNGLLFTADPYSKIINPDDKNTAMLFGDAATVSVLKEGVSEDEGFGLRQFAFNTRGTDYRALHNLDGMLYMDGRAVFNFAVSEVPAQIDKLLIKAGLKMDDVDKFIFHQGSKFILDHLAKRMGLNVDQVPIGIERYGNTVSSSIPLILEKVLSEKATHTVILSGFGLGLSWASCLATR